MANQELGSHSPVRWVRQDGELTSDLTDSGGRFAACWRDSPRMMRVEKSLRRDMGWSMEGRVRWDRAVEGGVEGGMGWV